LHKVQPEDFSYGGMRKLIGESLTVLLRVVFMGEYWCGRRGCGLSYNCLRRRRGRSLRPDAHWQESESEACKT
jgi:hypothetical protein